MPLPEQARSHRQTTTRQREPQMQEQRRGSRFTHLTIALIATLAALALSAPLAQGAFGVKAFEADVTNQDGTVATQASGHPYATSAALSFNTTTQPGPFGLSFAIPDESVKDVVVEMPAGFVGSTTAVTKCTNRDLLGDGNGPDCPHSAQVGVARVEQPAFPETGYFPIYNMVTQPGVPATFGFNVIGVPVYLDARVRSESDYGVTVESRNTNQTMALLVTETTLWGVPADPSHDEQRCNDLQWIYQPNPGYCYTEGPDSGLPHSAGIPAKPLLTNVSDCAAGEFTIEMKAASWTHPDSWVEKTDTLEEGGSPVGVKGCEKVPFEPTAKIEPEARAAGVPTGLEATISIPGFGLENPKGIAQSSLRNASVTFPQGMSVSASSADGLTGCTEAEARLGSAEAAQCPDASKLGTVEVETPLLANTLQGSVYLATQGTNPFKSLLALYISVDDPTTGIVLKIPGKVSPAPQTGQLTASFEDAPQLPFSEFRMRLKGGNRAALVTPSECGTHVSEATLAGWANPGNPVSLPTSFTIDRNCDAKDKFTPGFTAGTTNPVAGHHSPFTLRVTRPDGQQNVASIQTTLPEGVLAKLAGVPLCGEADANTGNCPSGSQVGTATVGSGAGSNPLYVPQPGKAPTAVYLAGPYKGAPYSLIAKVPAQAGPFDLGTVTVRNTIAVNPTTAQVSVKSDPLPQILQGIPIAYRDIRVDVDKPQFTLNPTSCDPTEVKGLIGSSQGTDAKVADRFQVAGCGDLAFKPKLILSVKGPTHRSANPRLKAVLTMPKGGANIERAQVTLPKTEILAQEHIRTICTRVQYNAGKGGGDQCPKASIYGKAKAWSPLLDKPLQGPVFLRSSSNELPDLVASLDGQIHVDLVGRIDAVNARIRNTFEGVPDAPVSRFVLEMQGGKKGLLVNNTELCKTVPRATVAFDGQNGKIADSSPVMRADCGKKAKKRSGAKKR
jgi:hypothetical protein